MEISDRYKKSEKCYCLGKSIHGLKQSSLVGYLTLTDILTKNRFTSTNFDSSVFIIQKKSTYLAINVDDILMIGGKSKKISILEDTLHAKFECTDFGTAHYILGIQVDINKQGISLSQQTYIQKVLKQFELVDCHSVNTSLDPGTQFRKGELEDKIDDPTIYQSVIGSLMYAYIGIGPDLAQRVTLLSQFSAYPSNSYLTAAKRVLRYLKGTIDGTLHYPLQHDFILHGFTDS